METLRVSRLRARYRLPAGEPEGRARLDRVLRRALDEALEPALAAAGIPAHGEVCLREVAAPARLRLAEGDGALAAGWARAIAGAVREAVDSGGAGVVRYTSAAHALADLVEGVARGDLRRAWAWRQLGLWTGDSPAPASEAVRALAARPALAVAVLAECSGALVLLAPRWSAGEWRRLAAVAAASAGAEAGSLTARSGGVVDGPAAVADVGGGAAGGSDGVRSRVERRPAPSADAAAVAVLRASRIAAAAVRAGVTADPEVRRAAAVLALLEVEPSAASAGSAAFARRVEAVDEAIREEAASRPPSPPLEDEVGRRAPAGEPAGTPSPDRDLLGRTRSTAIAPSSTDPSRSAVQTDAGPSALPPTSGTTDPVQASPPGAEEPARAQDPPAVADPAPRTESDDTPRPVRATGETRWGGLLFLLPLVDPAPPALPGRPPRWTLHALARTLVPMDERDPAALAFAGLPPGHEPPTRGEPPATREETDRLAELADAIRRALRARLERDDATAQETCRRTAVIEADPGWFDVHLRLDEVSLETRRAGLDLDPGWIPWLGVAVRFLYG
jgi:hypothetical protein